MFKYYFLSHLNDLFMIYGFEKILCKNHMSIVYSFSFLEISEWVDILDVTY